MENRTGLCIFDIFSLEFGVSTQKQLHYGQLRLCRIYTQKRKKTQLYSPRLFCYSYTLLIFTIFIININTKYYSIKILLLSDNYINMWSRDASFLAPSSLEPIVPYLGNHLGNAICCLFSSIIHYKIIPK